MKNQRTINPTSPVRVMGGRGACASNGKWETPNAVADLAGVIIDSLNSYASQVEYMARIIAADFATI